MEETRPRTTPPTRAPPGPRRDSAAVRPTSQPNLFLLFGRLVDRFDDAMERDLVRRRLVIRLATHDSDEVRELGAIRLDERALAIRRASRRHVGGTAVQLLHDAK